MPSSACKKRGLRSEEHTSELQSNDNLVCRLLIEKLYRLLRRSQLHRGSRELPHGWAADSLRHDYMWPGGRENRDTGRVFFYCYRAQSASLCSPPVRLYP